MAPLVLTQVLDLESPMEDVGILEELNSHRAHQVNVYVSSS
jgi:hypothetical protein